MKFIISAAIGLALAVAPLSAANGTPPPVEVCVPSEAYTEVVVVSPEIPEQTVTEYQRYSWTGGPIDAAPTVVPPHADWQANTSNYKDGDPVGIAFQRDKPGKGNADWFFWGTSVKVVQPYVPPVTETVEHPAVVCPPPVVDPGPQPDPEFRYEDRLVIDCEADFAATWRTAFSAGYYLGADNTWILGDFIQVGVEEQVDWREATDVECEPPVVVDPEPPVVVEPPVVTPEPEPVVPVAPAPEPVAPVNGLVELPRTGSNDAIVYGGLGLFLLVMGLFMLKASRLPAE